MLPISHVVDVVVVDVVVVDVFVAAAAAAAAVVGGYCCRWKGLLVYAATKWSHEAHFSSYPNSNSSPGTRYYSSYYYYC